MGDTVCCSLNKIDFPYFRTQITQYALGVPSLDEYLIHKTVISALLKALCLLMSVLFYSMVS